MAVKDLLTYLLKRKLKHVDEDQLGQVTPTKSQRNLWRGNEERERDRVKREKLRSEFHSGKSFSCDSIVTFIESVAWKVAFMLTIYASDLLTDVQVREFCLVT